MKLAIMQPYFLPYIGYFQLIEHVDEFVVYDNIQYTKSGWINRNRLLRDGRDQLFTLPLKHDSDVLNVVDRELSPAFRRDKLLNQVREAYRQAPHFSTVFPLIEDIVLFKDPNLFAYVFHSLKRVLKHLDIITPITISSSISLDHGLKGQEKVLAMCRALGAVEYVNPVGGMELYSRDAFRHQGIELRFLPPRLQAYSQLGQVFVPGLSILDVMMFNSVKDIREDLLKIGQML